MTEEKKVQKRNFPGHPPEDYKGSVAAWMVGLQEMGLWDGKNPQWYGDVQLTEAEYGDLLERCEGDSL